MRRASTPIVQPRLFDARTGGSERQFRNAVHYRGAGRKGRYVVVRLLPIIFFACEGNVPLLTVERRVPVVAARGNVSGFVCRHIGEHSLPTSGFPFDNRSALWLLLAQAVWAHSRILPRGSAAAHLGLSGRQVCPTRRRRGPHFRLPALGLAAILHVAISTPRHVGGFSNRSDRVRRRQGPGLAPQLGHEHSGETSCDPGILRCWQAPACSASSV